MNIPDFSDFLASIDIDDLAKRYYQRTKTHLIRFNPQDKEAFGSALSMIYQEAVSTSLEFLEIYHAWLQSNS